MALLLASIAVAGTAHAVPGGDLGVLLQGRYFCEVPDPMGVTRGIPEPNVRFQVVNSSSYRDQGVIGSYLKIGDSVTLTSGPRTGERYRAVSSGTLQRLDAAGRETSARCVLQKRNTR